MEIRRDDLSSCAIRELLEEHVRNMYELSPPESAASAASCARVAVGEHFFVDVELEMVGSACYRIGVQIRRRPRPCRRLGR